MKRKTELILILGVILFFLIIGTISGYTQSREVVGKYVTGDPDEYLDIKKDGTFYLKEKGKYSDIVGAPETTGKWKIEKDEMIFSHPLGIVTRWKVKPNVLIDDEGKTWFKEGCGNYYYKAEGLSPLTFSATETNYSMCDPSKMFAVLQQMKCLTEEAGVKTERNINK